MTTELHDEWIESSDMPQSSYESQKGLQRITTCQIRSTGLSVLKRTRPPTFFRKADASAGKDSHEVSSEIMRLKFPEAILEVV